MNSLGLSKKVNWLYLDTNEGLIYFEIYDIIQPGIVDWSKVKKWVFDISYNILYVCLMGRLPEGIMSFRDFARQFYVEDLNPAYKLEVFRSTSGDTGSCRISSRNTSKGKSLQFYRGTGETREYLVMDDSEDYLKFDCREE